MKAFEKKWARLLLSAGITLALLIVLFITVVIKLDNVVSLLGMFTLVGQTLYFLAFDTFADSKKKKVEILRNALVILGTAINLFLSFMTFLIVLSQKEFKNPWVEAFSTMWFLYTVINFIFYFIVMKKTENDWPEILNCFVALASLIVCYFINVIFLYLGIYIHSFFNFYFGLIISVILMVIVILIIKKQRGILFFGTKMRRFNEYYAKKQAQEEKEEGYQNNDGTETCASSYDYAFDQLKLAIDRAVNDVESEWEHKTYYYGVVEAINTAISISKLTKTINAEIKFDFRASTDVPNVSKMNLADEAQTVRSLIKKELEKSINDEIQGLSSEFKLLGKDWKAKINPVSRIV